MGKWLGVLLAVLLAAAAAFYFLVHQPQQVALQAAQQALASCARATGSLRGRVADLEAIRSQLQQSGTELAQKVAEKEKELEAQRSTQDQLVAELQGEIADKTVQVERVLDQLRVDMVDEVLFDSGEATLKPAGIAVLRKIGGVLAKAENRRIEVQGHTDNVPIVGSLARRFPTNWELSAARATNVVRFLQDEAKLDPRRLTASGCSEYRPKGPNDTEAGRRANRRIEILLIPIPPPSTEPAAS
jgi:chemotaxis protein MotB